MSVQIAAVPAAGQEERKILHAGSPRLAGMAWQTIPIVANMPDVESFEHRECLNIHTGATGPFTLQGLASRLACDCCDQTFECLAPQIAR